jgi:hypothetical protein
MQWCFNQALARRGANGIDVPMPRLAQLIPDVVLFTGRFDFDISKPDGTRRKLLDVANRQGSAGGRGSIRKQECDRPPIGTEPRVPNAAGVILSGSASRIYERCRTALGEPGEHPNSGRLQPNAGRVSIGPAPQNASP